VKQISIQSDEYGAETRADISKTKRMLRTTERKTTLFWIRKGRRPKKTN